MDTGKFKSQSSGDWFKRYMDVIIHGESDHWEQTHLMYESLPKVTLSALTETGQEESSIPVPKQRRYTGSKPVISSSLAGTLCSDLGVDGMLEQLNTTLGTSYTLETPGLSFLLNSYISKNYDFDSQYVREARDQEMRHDVLGNERIISHWVPPRRVWDLYSNRVTPCWISQQMPWGISHAWMNEGDRKNVLTPINREEWPAPIPCDANLDLIRIEMLNAGAEYVWLDVLCLRQKGGPGEGLRAEEWKLDVPTIGWVYYRAKKVVCYFCGLGLPLSFKVEDDFDDDRCWFRRAWTLQEIHEDMIMGGKTSDGMIMQADTQARFNKELSSLQSIRDPSRRSVFDLLSLMQSRVSSYPVDKVAGLVYPLVRKTTPVYNWTQSEEDAWTALVNEMNGHYGGQMLFLYSAQGNGRKFWRPSWKQAMTEKLPSSAKLATLWSWVCHTEEMDDSYEGPLIESCYVQGLAQRDLEGRPRWGQLVVEDGTDARTKGVFAITATHEYMIPDGSYTLLGSTAISDDVMYWVVGERLSDQRFKKLSVFEMPGREEQLKLKKLGIAKESRTFLA
ncbi:uncharacterized protein ARMOST_12376 [Armillaria ostoyae]|uniref:Heterokaryon incompatibility domain-containing protein n=1 Tax=Armillaria ostoyae TaxID=47428 RepID=A0A284RJR9_ARMOS|nr:uncharacterized protein ARMOST_12376 [Armillaria ostoyae]